MHFYMCSILYNKKCFEKYYSGFWVKNDPSKPVRKSGNTLEGFCYISREKHWQFEQAIQMVRGG